MQKSSSRHSNRMDTNSNSEPPSGEYPTDESIYSTTTFKRTTKKTTIEEQKCLENDENSEYDSMDEYQVTFPTVELKLPRHHHHHHRRHRSKGGEKVTVTRNVDRRHVYGESDCKDSLSECTTYTYSSNPDRSSLQSPDVRTDRTAISRLSSASGATDRTYNSQHRLQSIGNFFTSIYEFFRNNPKLTKFLFGIVMCYVIVCNLEVLIPRVIAIFVRLCYPWARYSAVVAEQFFSTFANMFTRLDAVIYASYCEFAAKYCRSSRLMCDVTCSFVDHVLSQARPTLAPIPQN